ncbi:hypothetical protein INT47_007648 [Mucor saturninus]|uniref:Conotoxin n=1 Tax=Mucor saturninus TaxID=64648 RepID=A0A8H7R964_9FUNG|nr:hypothetical protein INT47_007648 [Mucor saturninus]
MRAFILLLTLAITFLLGTEARVTFDSQKRQQENDSPVHLESAISALHSQSNMRRCILLDCLRPILPPPPPGNEQED